MVWTTLLSGAFGALSGAAQGYLDKREERKNASADRQLELDKFKVEQETALKLADKNLSAEKIKAAIVKSEEVKTISQQQKKEYTDFAKAVEKLSFVDVSSNGFLDKLSRFITSLVRPLSTIVSLALVVYLSIAMSHGDYSIEVLNYSYATLDFILAFWFVRRGYEKCNKQYITQPIKKK